METLIQTTQRLARLQNMLLTFRVSELQMLLGYAGQNKTGRKTELQARALELLTKSTSAQARQIHSKIRELYKSIQQGGSVMQGSSSGVPPTSLEMTLDNRSSVLTSNLTPIPRGISAAPPPPPPASSQIFIPPTMSTRNNVYGGLYAYPPKIPQPPPPPVYPIQPDVRFKRLPFYEIMGELLKPSSLVTTQREQNTTFVFYLTPTQASEVAMNREVGPTTKNEYPVQVQMRFCLLETSCEQEDIFPPGLVVKVNGKLCPLPNPIPINRPNVEPKRPPRPVNISNWCKLCPSVANQVAVSWTPEYGRGYVISVNLVKKLTANDLLLKMKAKGIRHADFTTGLIKEKLCEDADSEIATTSLRVSLLCPLGKMRMTTPCRPSTCTHLQCFDASLFLQMNEKKPTWACPVCDKPAAFDNLVIDGYFQQVLVSSLLPADCHEIQLHKDGSWTGQATKKEAASVDTPTKQEPIEEIIDDLDETSQPEIKTEEFSVKKKEEPCEGSSTPAAGKTGGKVIYTVDLTCSDSEEEDGGASVNNSLAPQSDKVPASSTASNQSTASTDNRQAIANGQLSGKGVLDTGYLSWVRNSTAIGTNTHSSSSNSGGRNSSSPSVITLDSPSPPPRIPTPTFDQAFMDLSQITNTGEGHTVVSGASQQPEQPAGVTSSSTPPSLSNLSSLPVAADASSVVAAGGAGVTSSQIYPGSPTHPQYSFVRLPQGSRYHPY
ncbi:E3 SUMO-protein ligase Su(var)2-10 isoform X3 [Rhodnius prolixus]|uniref:E3 SUMO-protein ligase Su(var)2-10 isoform X3 n=1 Tax=Rhodnius prolixus TaxID=13249 RepID=UPI003D18F0DA